MTRYQSGAAFRQALEERLLSRSLASNIPLVRLRKTVAFDRFLARLENLQPGKWILKGGFAIQLRLADQARTTKDIDVLALVERRDILPSLRNAGKMDLGDWFQFEVERGSGKPDEFLGGFRFPIQSLLDGRTFESFHLDVGIGDPMIGSVEELEIPSLLGFADFPPTHISCYPITQQIAEKVHAYTRPHVSGEGSRVKDFVDILLLAALSEMHAERLRQAIHATFLARKTHELPPNIPNPPARWSKPFRKFTSDVLLQYQSLAEANLAFKHFLDPVIGKDNITLWDPSQWRWS